MKENQKKWLWVASVYFIQGLPNALCAGLAQIYYISQGLALSTATLITSLIYLPWALKALWAPFLDMYSKKRTCIIFSSFLMGLVFLALSLVNFLDEWVLLSAISFWALAFLSATYDICADGYYMLSLNEKDQTFFVGIRSAFYRLSILFVQGGLIAMAGLATNYFASEKLAWALVLLVCMMIFFSASLFFKAILVPVEADVANKPSKGSSPIKNFFLIYIDFFKSKGFINILIFLLLYRFAEAQLSKVAPAFLLADVSEGGLGLSLASQGLIYGTVGTISLFAGGIIGGVVISKIGLLKCLIPFALAINIPNIVYLLMAYAPSQNLALVASLVSVEQFGYGLGFSSYMAFMLFSVSGKNKTSQYAILSSIMALSLLLNSFYCGYIQEFLGYKNFFLWIILSSVISFLSLISAFLFLKQKKADF